VLNAMEVLSSCPWRIEALVIFACFYLQGLLSWMDEGAALIMITAYCKAGKEIQRSSPILGIATSC
jgi:hypothetical protein